MICDNCGSENHVVKITKVTLAAICEQTVTDVFLVESIDEEEPKYELICRDCGHIISEIEAELI